MPPKGFKSITIKAELYDKLAEAGLRMKPAKLPAQLLREILKAWLKINAPTS